MGMTIDEIISVLDDMKVKIDIPKAAVMQNNKNYALDVAIDTMRKYQKFQDQALSLYMERLKADLVAMLTEIQLEIEEMDSGCGWEGYRPTAQVIGLIQQKINALKGEE